MPYESDIGKKIKKKMERVLKKHGIPVLRNRELWSIEELARLSTEIEGLGIGYLSSSQIRWLYSGGFEAFKEAKPMIYELLKEMEKVPCDFPVNLSEMAETVQERIREKAKRGEVDQRWEKIRVRASEIEVILRFKRDPFRSREELKCPKKEEGL